jgi:hypothetical protein
MVNFGAPPLGIGDSRAAGEQGHARQASRQAKRRQAAALQNGLGADEMCAREEKNRGSSSCQGFSSGFFVCFGFSMTCWVCTEKSWKSLKVCSMMVRRLP